MDVEGPIMLRGRIHPSAMARWWTHVLLVSCLSVFLVTPLRAQDTAAPGVTIGAGLRTSFTQEHSDTADGTAAFVLNSVQLYVRGPVTKRIKFMVNTEYDGASNGVSVLDAVAQFAVSPKFNVWVGRFLPPSDRANLYGPYYAQHWAVFTDGVQDGYPSVSQGRDNGAMYWGQFGRVKVSGGAFDGTSTTGNQKLIGAGRVQVDFWEAEDGHYLNGTYYGAKNLLAIGVAGQFQGGASASSVDFLLERKIGHGGAFSVETEFAKYERLGGYDSRYATDTGGYVLASYLFPAAVGAGKVAVVGKFAKAMFSNGLNVVDEDYSQKTSELNLNYIIKDFNARVMLFYKDTRYNAVRINFKQMGVGIQLQI